MAPRDYIRRTKNTAHSADHGIHKRRLRTFWYCTYIRQKSNQDEIIASGADSAFNERQTSKSYHRTTKRTPTGIGDTVCIRESYMENTLKQKTGYSTRFVSKNLLMYDNWLQETHTRTAAFNRVAAMRLVHTFSISVKRGENKKKQGENSAQRRSNRATNRSTRLQH